MSVLSIIQDACNQIGLLSPGMVVGSADQQLSQLQAILQEESFKLSTGASVARAYTWQAQTVTASYSATGVQLQGAMTTLAPGFMFLTSETMWDQSVKRPIFGALNAQERELLIASSLKGPFPQFWIQGGNLNMVPPAPAGDTISFEYQTRYVWKTAGGSLSATISADSDTCLLDEQLITMGLVWRWRKTKGLDYAEDFRDYQTAVLQAMTQDRAIGRQSLGGEPTNRYPGIMVPQGSWGH